MIFILQILIYLILFTVAIKAVAGNNPVGNIYRCMEWHYRFSDCLYPGASLS